ncbi:centrosomal protein of 104 kDa-like isoform X1 [Lytechinus pictus]|uniref:centrosomal protein of 104 kDa-like isoform X1 n=1 Tax=Lytechinus pictus TaxID=7653 RepID=UPI0030B9EE07
MPHKIPFSVIYASSTDEGFNCKELEIHNPLVKGWVGGRFCLYPQEIVLRMPDKTRIRKLQLLAHQFLIPTKIEFYVGSLPPDHITSLNGQRYKRLGYITLSDNAKTSFKARELKSVHVDAVGKYLRLVVYKNHVNKHNLYNQVGMVAVNIIGDELGSDNKNDVGGNRVNDVINQHMPQGSSFNGDDLGEVDPVVLGAINKPDYISPMDDLAFDMYQDPEVANIIRKLDNRKNEAVIQEEFDLAKRLKQAVSDLQKVGERLGRYEVEKRRAIETEDYDLAKVKKIQMEEYRLQIYKQLELYDLLDISKNLVWPLKDWSMQNNDPNTHQHPQKNAAPDEVSPRREPRREEPTPRDPVTPPPNNQEHHKSPGVSPRDSGNFQPGSFMYNADDRPLPTLKNSPRHPPPDLPPVEEPETARTEDDTGGAAPGGGTLGGEQIGAMSENNMRELDAASEVVGRDKVMKIYSKSWALREEGFGDVRSQVEELDEGKDKEEVRAVLRAAIFLATKGLKDKVFTVFNNAVDLTRFLFTEFIPSHKKLGKGETSQGVDRILPELMARIGDTNAKLKTTAIDFIVEMASFPEVRPLHTIPTHCQTPFKNNTQAKMAVTKVEIIEKLIKELGVDKNSGMSTSSIMKFANRGLEHPAGIVRDASINLIFELYKLKGSDVMAHLPSSEQPSTMKNPLYVRIYDGFDKIDGKPTRAELKAQAKAAKDNEKKAKKAEIDELQNQLAELRAAAAKNAEKKNNKTPDKNVAKSVDKGSDKKAPADDKNKLKAPQNKKIPPRAPSIADASEYGEDIDQQCIFCGEKDPKFKDEGLDLHYWKFCPMLTKCQNCKQVVEISTLTEHILTECEKRADFAQCPRCSETHSKADIDRYVSEKLCQPSKPGTARCPYCHLNIPEGEDSWKRHLMSKDGCKASKRRESYLKRGKATPSSVRESNKGSIKSKPGGKKEKEPKPRGGKTPRVK